MKYTFNFSFQLSVLNSLFRTSFSLEQIKYLLHELHSLITAFYYIYIVHASFVLRLGDCQRDILDILWRYLARLSLPRHIIDIEFVDDEARD